MERQGSAVEMTLEELTAALDGGHLAFHDVSHEVLARCSFQETAFKGIVSGVAVANRLEEDDSTKAGTVDHAHLVSSSGDELGILSVTLRGNGGEVQMFHKSLGEGDSLLTPYLGLSESGETITGYAGPRSGSRENDQLYRVVGLVQTPGTNYSQALLETLRRPLNR